MKVFQGVRYDNCEDITDEEMEAIHSMGTDDRSRMTRECLYDRKGWNASTPGLFVGALE